MSLLESSISVFSQHFPQREQRMRNRFPKRNKRDSKIIAILVALQKSRKSSDSN
jgi:hypothetical protein